MDTNQNTNIRLASLADLDVLHALEQMCSRNPWSRENLSYELSSPNSIFLVLEETGTGEIIGFISSQTVIDELQILEVAIHPDHRNLGWGEVLLHHLMTEVERVSAKRALHATPLRRLMTEVERVSAKRALHATPLRRLTTEAAQKNIIARATLEVRASNHPAIRLYEKCGFVKDGVRKGYYQDGEDAVLMSKILCG